MNGWFQHRGLQDSNDNWVRVETAVAVESSKPRVMIDELRLTERVMTDETPLSQPGLRTAGTMSRPAPPSARTWMAVRWASLMRSVVCTRRVAPCAGVQPGTATVQRIRFIRLRPFLCARAYTICKPCCTLPPRNRTGCQRESREARQRSVAIGEGRTCVSLSRCSCCGCCAGNADVPPDVDAAPFNRACVS